MALHIKILFGLRNTDKRLKQIAIEVTASLEKNRDRQTI